MSMKFRKILTKSGKLLSEKLEENSMKSVNIHEAKTKLSTILHEIEEGEIHERRDP